MPNCATSLPTVPNDLEKVAALTVPSASVRLPPLGATSEQNRNDHKTQKIHYTHILLPQQKSQTGLFASRKNRYATQSGGKLWDIGRGLLTGFVRSNTVRL